MEVTMTEVPMERYLLDMPYEILFEIFRGLPKGKLFEISRFSSKVGNVAEDARLWKDVYIRYEPSYKLEDTILAFEELYSGPFPVKVIELSHLDIDSPVSFESDQVVKVTKLIWNSVGAEKAAFEAMLAKYQLTELHLDLVHITHDGHITGIAPEAFSKQTGLEALSLRRSPRFYIYPLVATVLSKYCRNLKYLDLSYNDLTGLDLAFVESLPKTLEKLYLVSFRSPRNSFFELLAEGHLHLKEIGLHLNIVHYPALLKLKFLETLRIISHDDQDIRHLYEYLIRFPALKNVHMIIYAISGKRAVEKSFEALRTKLRTATTYVTAQSCHCRNMTTCDKQQQTINVKTAKKHTYQPRQRWKLLQRLQLIRNAIVVENLLPNQKG